MPWNNWPFDYRHTRNCSLALQISSTSILNVSIEVCTPKTVTQFGFSSPFTTVHDWIVSNWALRNKTVSDVFLLSKCYIFLICQKKNSPNSISVLREHNTKYPHYLLVVTGTLFATFGCVYRYIFDISFLISFSLAFFVLLKWLFDWDLLILLSACSVFFCFAKWEKFLWLNGRTKHKTQLKHVK